MQDRLSSKYKDKIIKYIDSYIIRHSLLCIIMVYNTIILITSAALYLLIPILLCYEENVRENSRAVDFSYDMQFIIGTLIAMAASTIILRILLRDIDRYRRLSNREEGLIKLKAIRKKCMNIPYAIYLYQLFLPVVIGIIISLLALIVLHLSVVLVVKLISVIFSFCFISAIISYTFSRYIFARILYDTYTGYELDGFRIEIGTKIFGQIIPMIIASILIVSLLGYAKIVDEKGDMLKEIYRTKLEAALENPGEIRSSAALFEALKNIKMDGVKTSYFISAEDGSIIGSDGTSFPAYLTNFITNPVDGDIIYGYTKETQGVVQKININGHTEIAGVVFEVVSQSALEDFAIALTILLIINVFTVYWFSKSISREITQVSDNFMKIGQDGNIGYRENIPVISNDEIGDLVIAFNKIQRLENEYDEMKNEFFANVSHELRTPLNIILSSIQLLSSLEKSDDEDSFIKDFDRISEMIKQNSYRLLRLVNNLIDSSKIRASFYDLHMRNQDIVNVVEEISMSVANYIKEKNVDFIFDTDMEERVIACDADMIERIMLNLLSNAVKFTGSGGNVIVRMFEENNNIIISVKDNGIGMNEDEQKEIFERFRQVDKSLARKREGSGIGLSLVKLLVEMHRGSISVKSEPGKGAEFIVALPAWITNEQGDSDYLDKQIYSEKVENNIEKIKVEFSDIYF